VSPTEPPARVYPVGLHLQDRRVVVVGGGSVAQRRVAGLHEVGADTLVVSPTLTTALEALADSGEITWHARPYAHVRDTIREAATSYLTDVTAGSFPGPEQTVRMDDAVLDEVLGRGEPDRATGTIPAGIPLDRDL